LAGASRGLIRDLKSRGEDFGDDFIGKMNFCSFRHASEKAKSKFKQA
jgi:hypothetical protein